MSHALQRPLSASDMPMEMWQRIFDFVPLKTLLAVRATSQYLRDAINVHPQFCTDIEYSPHVVSLDFLGARVGAGITTSGRSPLNLKLAFVDIDKPKTDDGYNNRTWERLPVAKVLTTVTPCVNFIRTLDVAILEEDYYASLLPLLQLPAPALASLRLEIVNVDNGLPGPTLPNDLFQGDAPQLKHIALFNITVPNRPTVVLESVTSVQWLGGVGASCYYDLLDDYELLLPSVSELELGGVSMVDVALEEAMSQDTLSAIGQLKSLRLSTRILGNNAEMCPSLPTKDISTVTITADVSDEENAESFLSLVSELPSGNLSLTLSVAVSQPGCVNLSVASLGERRSTRVLEVIMPSAKGADDEKDMEKRIAFIWLFKLLEDARLVDRVTELGADAEFGHSIISECLLRLRKAHTLALAVHCDDVKSCNWLAECEAWSEYGQDQVAKATGEEAIQPDDRLKALRHVRLTAPYGPATLDGKAAKTAVCLIQRMPEELETYGAELSALTVPQDVSEALRVAALPRY